VDGKTIIKDAISGPQSEAERLGVTLAEKLLKQGADVILREVYGKNPDYSGNSLLEN
jgi:hydroxymethylbilane synthase